jgi:apolipoprotein N-acyltransferase
MPTRAAPKSRPHIFHNFAVRLRKVRGFRRVMLAFAYGALTSLAYSPADIVPVLAISFPALIFLLQGAKSWRTAFFLGWSFAFGFFVFDLYWTAASMFVDIEQFWWAVPLAACGLPAAFAIYYGLAAMLARMLGLQGASGAVRFALAWFLADYARGHFFTGFPWNLEGYAWVDFAPVLQLASLIGMYGLTLLTLAAACLPAALADETSPMRRRLLLAGLGAALALTIMWGAERISGAGTATVPHVRLRLVQPDIMQEMKWKDETREKNFVRLLALSTGPAEKPVTHIIWPETAATYYLAEDTEHRNAIAAIVPPGGAVLTGVLRHELDAFAQVHFYNSLIAVNRDSKITAVYDKAHLVPFGEYIPYRDVLPIPPIAGMGLDFSHGPGPRTLRVEGLPSFSPFICYEAIFPGAVVDRADPPQFLLNVTNDGWYGNTAGPWQHFAIARARAVEEGLPLVRVANTGISGIIDPYGRVLARLDLGKRGIIDGDLPLPLPTPAFFSRAGEEPLWLIFAALMLIAAAGRFRKK